MIKPNSSLSQFIEEFPLYSKFGTNQPIESVDLNNLEFNFYCKNEKRLQPFKLEATRHNGFSHNGADTLTEAAKVDFTEIFSGICRSCESYKINIVINGGVQKEAPKYFIRKIGQYPAPESPGVKLPQDIADFLMEVDRDLYSKGLKNLELEYGIGAMSYFKRMIENELQRIIETISNPYTPDGRKIAEAFATYRESGQKIKFIDDITPHLPKCLQEHGANILLVFHDAATTGIHELTEKECIKKSKDIDTLFRYLVRKLSIDVNEGEPPKFSEKYFLRYS